MNVALLRSDEAGALIYIKRNEDEFNFRCSMLARGRAEQKGTTKAQLDWK